MSYTYPHKRLYTHDCIAAMYTDDDGRRGWYYATLGTCHSAHDNQFVLHWSDGTTSVHQLDGRRRVGAQLGPVENWRLEDENVRLEDENVRLPWALLPPRPVVEEEEEESNAPPVGPPAAQPIAVARTARRAARTAARELALADAAAHRLVPGRSRMAARHLT
jgi:hypothetical protein